MKEVNKTYNKVVLLYQKVFYKRFYFRKKSQSSYSLTATKLQGCMGTPGSHCDYANVIKHSFWGHTRVPLVTKKYIFDLFLKVEHY